MRMRVAKICPPVNKPTRLISPKSSGPEVGLLSVDYCIYWKCSIALSWNDIVLSAYRIAFAGERNRGRKQRDFAPKNAIQFVPKLIIFQKIKLDIGENLGRLRTDVYQSIN